MRTLAPETDPVLLIRLLDRDRSLPDDLLDAEFQAQLFQAVGALLAGMVTKLKMDAQDVRAIAELLYHDAWKAIGRSLENTHIQAERYRYSLDYVLSKPAVRFFQKFKGYITSLLGKRSMKHDGGA